MHKVRIGILLVAVLLLTVISVSAASGHNGPPENPGQTCDKEEYPEDHKAEGAHSVIDEEWGTVTANRKEVVFDIDAGWQVDICIKAGHDLIELTATSTTPTLKLDHAVSHMSWRNPIYTELPPTDNHSEPAPSDTATPSDTPTAAPTPAYTEPPPDAEPADPVEAEPTYTG